MNTVNVVCMKWGTLYGADYVNRLYNSVRRNTSKDFRFICFTDNGNGILDDVEILPLPPIYVPSNKSHSPWRKLSLFNENLGELKGRTLFLDLDVVILDSIDCFFDYSDKFCIIENWTQKGRGIGNSSVYCFNVGEHADILQYYNDNKEEVFSQFDNEQMYLSSRIKNKEFWPKEWCQSFKFHSIPKGLMRYFNKPAIPEGCRVLVFHGNPNPDQALVGDYGKKLRKYFKAADWISDYWL